ncbi:hypothetical protein B0H13DRAFT_2563271 [Mycena leptocephala]|nr:hypothetical protein B0H13DRAFT_2563271 [Mycena leptocephala]
MRMTRPLLSIAAAFSTLALDNVLAQQRHVRVPTLPTTGLKRRAAACPSSSRTPARGPMLLYIAPYPACPCAYRIPNRGRCKTSAEI